MILSLYNRKIVHMKKLLALVIAVGQSIISFGQQPIIVKTRAQEAIVYLSGAEIKSIATVPLKQGMNSIQFKGLSPSFISKSLQVTVGNNVEVRSVSTHTEQLLLNEVNPELKDLTDSITLLQDKIELINNQVDAYNMEKQVLAQNQRMGGTQGSVSLQDLTKATDFFRERTLLINNSLTVLNKNLKSLSEILSRKKMDFNTETAKINRTRYVVDVLVNSPVDQRADFMIRYSISDAYWEASYDIIATEINKPIALKYKAEIYNDSGIDWKEVKLSLATGDISVSAARPYLTSWILNYTSVANEGYLNAIVQQTANQEEINVPDQGGEEVKAVSELSTFFAIERQHTILNGNGPYRIDLQTETLQAAFEYLTVPKMELSAFLIAKVTGWEKFNLIDGKANVYYDNSYIGESAINTRLIGDTLELSLGRDNQIVVSRSKIEDRGSTSAIGGKRSESFVYEIQIKNNRKVPVLVRVQDQIPVSQEKEITVDVSEISSARLDASSGRLQWLRSLPSGEAIKYKIAFAVKYPKNKTVAIRKSRMVKMPLYRQEQRFK
jgi:uncharacterized protein (TIGR02231 family)